MLRPVHERRVGTQKVVPAFMREDLAKAVCAGDDARVDHSVDIPLARCEGARPETRIVVFDPMDDEDVVVSVRRDVTQCVPVVRNLS
jgi:hypothetical protein